MIDRYQYMINYPDGHWTLGSVPARGRISYGRDGAAESVFADWNLESPERPTFINVWAVTETEEPVGATIRIDPGFTGGVYEIASALSVAAHVDVDATICLNH